MLPQSEYQTVIINLFQQQELKAFRSVGKTMSTLTVSPPEMRVSRAELRLTIHRNSILDICLRHFPMLFAITSVFIWFFLFFSFLLILLALKLIIQSTIRSTPNAVKPAISMVRENTRRDRSAPLSTDDEVYLLLSNDP